MPENPPAPESKLRARVEALEKSNAEMLAAIKALLKGMKRVDEEIHSEWGEDCMEAGTYYGVEFK